MGSREFHQDQSAVQLGEPSAGQLNGSYFEPGSFKNVRDPQCAAVATNLQNLCTVQAVADAKSGQVILQNPHPGTRRNVGLNTLEYAGTWRADIHGPPSRFLAVKATPRTSNFAGSEDWLTTLRRVQAHRASDQIVSEGARSETSESSLPETATN